MGQYFGIELITNLTKSSSTVMYLPGGFTVGLGARGVSSSTALYCDITTSGFGGLDTGTLSWGLYYVYLVFNGVNYGLTMSLSSVSPTGFTVYRKVGAVLINSALQLDIAYSNSALASEAVLNTKNYLRNKTLLQSSDFPDTTGLYMWSVNGSSDANTIPNKFGGVDLTRLGSLTASSNHLGYSVYNAIDGASDVLYAPGTAFDTQHESFSVGGWYRLGDVSGGYLATKLVGVAADQSFSLYLSGGYLIFRVYYNSSGNYVDMNLPSSLLGDNLWHHIVAVYNQPSRTITVVIDGKVVGHRYDTNLATRNNTANTKLTFGGYGNGTVNNPILGSVADVFYKKTVLTLPQIRQLYVVGTTLQAYLDLNGRVKINGENLGDYWIEYPMVTTGPSWTPTFQFGVPYRGADGFPNLKFNIRGTVPSSSRSSYTISVDGISFNATAYQTGTGTAGGGVPLHYVQALTGSAIEIYHSTASTTVYNFNGDVRLAQTSWPSWALDLSKLY